MPSLLEVPLRQAVVVEEVRGDRSFRRRIMEMGLVPGTAVQVIAVAPLGDPLTLELRASRLSIRKREAAEVQVKPIRVGTQAASPPESHRGRSGTRSGFQGDR